MSQYQQLIRSSELLEGMDAVRHAFKGWAQPGFLSLQFLRKRALQIEKLAETFRKLQIYEIQEKLGLQRLKITNQATPPRYEVDQTMALLVESMHRVLKLRPYTVQIMGALAMQEGRLIEMATGEGKTLTASLTAVLWAWQVGNCHVVTSNDYLAKRDALEFEEFYQFCGLQCGYVTAEISFENRFEAYHSHITYCTGASVLADYLRDRLTLDFDAGSRKERMVQLQNPVQTSQRLVPPLRCAIIDEADSVLADNAITPLIISLPEEDADLLNSTRLVHSMMDELVEGEDFLLHERYRSVNMKPSALQKMEQHVHRFPESWRATYRVAFLMNKALQAKYLFHCNEHYVVLDGKVVIVDQQTGRPMPDMSWSDGLHQAVEAKEGLELTNPTKASTKMTFQAFFRKYAKLSGMSGTIASISGELWRIYGLPFLKIPTRLPRKHKSYSEKFLLNRTQQIQRIIDEVQNVNHSGQPILIGTRSVDESLEISRKLNELQIPHSVPNALEHEKEAEIVARAGQWNHVTIATNMAGRGTDIKPDSQSLEKGGLYVIGTEHHDSRRVDKQLIGRASRQGEPGCSKFILSLDDRLLKRNLPPGLWEFFRLNFSNPLFRFPLFWIYKSLQFFTEWKSSRLRVKMLLQEQKLRKAMSFVGRK
jgi:preprotein translocase subunit SecA